MGAPDKPTVQVGKTPQSQIATETPTTTAPGVQHQFFGAYGYWLGDSERRYGRLQSARNLPEKTKLEMLRDPVIALAMGFITSSLVKANRVIECTDESKRLFFEAMFRGWEQEFIIQSSMAVALGSCGLIKRWSFEVPQPQEIDAPAVWSATATPYIIRGFDQAYPITTTPRFDDKGRQFQGMFIADGEIDVFFSLWITMGQARAFGAYGGSGRLENVYKDWWPKQFGRDLYLVWLQKQINPATKVGYPPGSTGGKKHQDIALATGDSVRSGATVALPSDMYRIVDQMTGDERLSAVNKWTLEFLESSRSIGQFYELDDHHDAKMSLGMLLPPQMYLNVKQSALGGPTTADVLTKLAEDLLMMDAADIDRHVNDYVFAPVARANFPPDSPRVRVRTVGLTSEIRSQLFEIIKGLLGRADVDPSSIDVQEGLRRLGVPIVEATVKPKPDQEGEENPDEEIEEEAHEPLGFQSEPPGSQAGAGTGVADPAQDEANPSRATLEAMVEEELTPVPGIAEIIPSEADVRRAVRQLKDVLPELFENEGTG